MATVADLGKKVKAKYHGKYDDIEDAELGSRIKAKYPGSYDDFQGVTAQPKSDWRQTAVNALPTIGGLGGGILGGIAGGAPTMGVGTAPGAAEGAILGGAGGEAARQLASRALGLPAPATPAAAASQIGTQGALQGAMEGTGQLLNIGARLVGKPMMQAALRASPEVAQTALREGITATKLGLNKLMAKLGESGAAAQALADKATQQGVRIDANKDIVQGAFQDVMPSIRAGKDPIGEKARLVEMAKNWLEGRSANLTPTELIPAKQAADDAAAGIYRKGAKLEKQSAVDPLEAQFQKALGDRIRGALDRNVPGIAEQNAKSAELIRLKQAVWPVAKKELPFAARALGRSAPVLAGGTAGAIMGHTPQERLTDAAIGAGLGAGLGSPSALSTMALGNPALAQMLIQIPRAAAAFAGAGSQ